MAEEQVIISVDLDAGKAQKGLDLVTSKIADLKIRQQELKDQYKALAISEDYYLQESKKLSQEIGTLTRQQGNLTAAVKLSETTNDDYADSLDGMRAKLKDMQAAYATLSAEQRDSAEGKEFLRAIQEQDEAVKGLERSMGDARRNVGDYEGAIKRAFPALGNLGDAAASAMSTFEALGQGGTAALRSLVTGLGQATKAALKFIATPIGAIITAIAVVIGVLVGAFKKLQEAFAKNDEAGTALEKLFASFQPIIDGVSRAFDRLALGIGKVAEKLADWLGGANAAVKAAQDLVVAADNLDAAERDYLVNSAERNKKIAELRAMTAEKEKYSAEERIAALKEALDLEKKNLEDEKSLAAERLRILEETAKKESDTSDETARKIAEARAALFNAEEQYYSGTRKLLTQLNALEKEIAAERAERRAAAVEEAYRVYEEEAARIARLNEGLQALNNVEEERAKRKKEEEEELARLREEAESYIEEEEEEIISLEDVVRDKFGLDQEAIDYYTSLLESGMSADERFAAMSEFTAKRVAKSFTSAAGTMAGAFNDMAEMLNEYGAENDKAQKASKAFALAGILASQAQSIAEGALAITSQLANIHLPFPANLPAIATTVATITSIIGTTASSFMQAKELLAGAFEQGGIVGGTSYTGDKLIARVNSREMILTQQQQARLFDIVNTPAAIRGIDYEALAAAISALPAPVMDYTEFRQFEQQVSTYNEFANV